MADMKAKCAYTTQREDAIYMAEAALMEFVEDGGVGVSSMDVPKPMSYATRNP